MRLARLLPVVGLLTLATACDHKSPTVPAPLMVVTSLAIEGAEAVLTGVTATYSAKATLGDGTTQTGTTVWTSSNPEIAGVDAGGRVEGRTHGSTTLTATYLGLSASKTVQVVNNFGGTWQGRYTIRSCDAPRNLCDYLEWDWWHFPMRLEIAHSGNHQDEISAVLKFSNLHFSATVSGTVTSDGRLNLAGDSNIMDSRGRIWAILHIETWDTSLTGPDTMGGRWTQRRSVLLPEPGYDEHQHNEFELMTRVSTSLPAAAIH